MPCRKCGAEVAGAGLCPACISSVKSETGQISRQRLAQAARESGRAGVLDRHLYISYAVILAAFFPLCLLIYFHAPNLGALIIMLLSINLVIYFLGIVTWTMLFMEIAVESPFEGLMSVLFPYAIKIGLTSDSPRARQAAIIYSVVSVAGVIGWVLFVPLCGRGPVSAAGSVFGDQKYICPTALSAHERERMNHELFQDMFSKTR